MAAEIAPSVSGPGIAGTPAGTAPEVSSSVSSPEFSSGPPGVENFSSVPLEAPPEFSTDTAITPDSFSSFLASTEPLDLTQEPQLIDRQFNTPDSLLNATELNEAVGITSSSTGGLSIENFDFDPVKDEFHTDSDFKSRLTEAKHELDEKAAVKEAEDILKGHKPEVNKVDQDAVQIVEDLEQFVAGKEPESDALEIPMADFTAPETPGVVEILDQKAAENLAADPEIVEISREVELTTEELTTSPEVEQLMEETTEQVIEDHAAELLQAPDFRNRFETLVEEEELPKEVTKALADTQLDRGKIEEFIQPKTVERLLEEVEVSPEEPEVIEPEQENLTEEEMVNISRELKRGREVVRELTKVGVTEAKALETVKQALAKKGIELEDVDVLKSDPAYFANIQEPLGDEESQVERQQQPDLVTEDNSEEPKEEEKVKRPDKEKEKERELYFVRDNPANAVRERIAKMALKQVSERKQSQYVSGQELEEELSSKAADPKVYSEILRGVGAIDMTYKENMARIGQLGELTTGQANKKIEQILIDHPAVTISETQRDPVKQRQVEEVVKYKDLIYVAPVRSKAKIINRHPVVYTVEKAA